MPVHFRRMRAIELQWYLARMWAPFTAASSLNTLGHGVGLFENTMEV